jgi:hypothetical protein
MLTDIKYLKYTKCLCWSNKVKVGSAVFITMRFVFLLLGDADIGYGDLLSYLDACIMLFVLDASKYERRSPYPILASPRSKKHKSHLHKYGIPNFYLI